MKRKLQFISATAASVLAFSAQAQNPSDPASDAPPYAHNRNPMPDARAPSRLNEAVKASDLIGMMVKNDQDEKLGKVEELAVDIESGRIVQVIVSTGGFLGIRDTLTAVPPCSFHHDAAQRVLHLDADKEKLKDSPRFESSNWAECCDSNHLATVYRYYGQEPAFTFVSYGDANGERRPSHEGASNLGAMIKTNGYWVRGKHSSDGQCMIPESRLSHIQRASKVMGTPVKNRQDEKLGKVENLLVDLSSGRIVALVVSTGGFLGLGDELSAIPPNAFQFTSDRENLQLDASRESLASRPHFKSNQWADLGEPTYTTAVYRAYGVEPYFATDVERYANTSATKASGNNDAYAGDLKSQTETRLNQDKTQADLNRASWAHSVANTNANPAPDNTARNARDRSSQTLTPLDQGNSPADVNITAQIRGEIIADKTMSVNARNVKIITNQGRVTLRGPVNNADEKRLIGEIANRIASSGNVDNQLEVKIVTTSSNN